MKGFPRKQQYEVPIISNDLRHEELIHQIADSLDHLQTTMNDVFSKIGKRLSDNRTRLASINDRTRLAQAKIDHLSTTARKKATQVFSSSKFPAEDHPQTYRSILNSEDAPAMRTSKFKLKNRHHSPPTDKDVKEKLNFHPMPYERIEEKDQFDKVPEGLGSLPTNLDSVSSLLLFNTDENPYKNYVLIDPRGVVTRIRVEEEEQYAGPQDAPQTIGQREETEHANKQSLNYNPDLGNVPEFSVPTDLPDLPDIAGDIQFASEGFAAIAPSAFGQIPDLPDFQTTTSASAAPPPPGSGSAPPPPPPGVESSVASAAPPPPPPPPPPVAEAPPPPPPPAAAAPPPGPPPAAESQAPPPKPAAVPEAVGDRTNLMDAIRKSGGIGKLKGAAKKVIAEKRKEKPAPASGGGDMMADLMSRLTSRRKAMAGGGTSVKSGEAEAPKPPPAETASGNPMSKISDMIAYNPPDKREDNDAEWVSD